MSEGLRILLALALGGFWLVWVGAIWWRQRQTRLPRDTIAANLVVYASQTGQAHSMAEAYAKKHAYALLSLNQLTVEHLSSATHIDFYVSTYGDGEAPDNGNRFLQLMKSVADQSLHDLSVQVTALGDSQYPQFCAFGHWLYDTLCAKGARPLEKLTCIDASATPADHQTGQRCALLERRCLNSYSPFESLYELKIDSTKLDWQAGDWVDIQVPERTARWAKPRTYSVASVPENGFLRLIVRQLRKPDGSLGVASGFLTQASDIGDKINVAVRVNPMMSHLDMQAPLLLIAAGSGLAGVMGLIERRAQNAYLAPMWLIYGERDPNYDQPMADKLEQWHQTGVVERLDRPFSRRHKSPEYVQDRVHKHAQEITGFLAEQGQIYVCGSLTGMGKAVHQVLQEILGEHTLRQWTEHGRYHRDLY